ncbi:DUF1064 domain-containing protein [Acinetobacter beijerinckii]|uniref:DUF1064 domain-containing protein n=1 Tax=Acinetobacter beijerinckii TaxID=262668 RepID=UPI0030DB4596
MTSMSVEQYSREILKQSDKPKATKRNKFNAQKVELDGMTFDSKKEHKRYIELKAMQQRGEIRDLQHHTKFELAPKTKLEGEKGAKPMNAINKPNIESSNDQAISNCSLSNLCQNDTQNSLPIKQENQDMGDDSHIENHISPLCKVEVK